MAGMRLHSAPELEPHGPLDGFHVLLLEARAVGDDAGINAAAA